MSDTPRTDAAIIFPGGGIAMVRPEFARQLETELAQAKKDLRFRERDNSVLTNQFNNQTQRITGLTTELAHANAQVNELNCLLRNVGWGQGEIDSSATLAEKCEAIREAGEALADIIRAALRSTTNWEEGRAALAQWEALKK